MHSRVEVHNPSMARSKHTARLKSEKKSTATAKQTAKAKPEKPTEKPPRRKRRYHPGTKALWAIKRLQKSTDLLVPKRPIGRLIREIVQDLFPGADLRFRRGAMEALHAIAEVYITEYFQDGMVVSVSEQRKTLFVRDLRVAQMLRQRK